MLFPEYSVYLWTMAGFLVFYGLETMAASSQQGQEKHAGGHEGEASWQPWVHLSGFALYTWLLTYMMVWTGKSDLTLGLFAVAMGMHIFTITCNLSSHYQAVYDRRGAYLLALASLAGWVSGTDFAHPHADPVEPGGLRVRRCGCQCGDRRAPQGEGGPVLVLSDGRDGLYGPAADSVPLREGRVIYDTSRRPGLTVKKNHHRRSGDETKQGGT